MGFLRLCCSQFDRPLPLSSLCFYHHKFIPTVCLLFCTTPIYQSTDLCYLESFSWGIYEKYHYVELLSKLCLCLLQGYTSVCQCISPNLKSLCLGTGVVSDVVLLVKSEFVLSKICSCIWSYYRLLFLKGSHLFLLFVHLFT